MLLLAGHVKLLVSSLIDIAPSETYSMLTEHEKSGHLDFVVAHVPNSSSAGGRMPRNLLHAVSHNFIEAGFRNLITFQTMIKYALYLLLPTN